jgi:hypothetical protein
MLINDNVVTRQEVADGRESLDPAAFEQDRIQDARLTALGYQVLRWLQTGDVPLV